MAELNPNRRLLLGGVIAATFSAVVILAAAAAIDKRSSRLAEHIQIQHAQLQQVDDRWLFDYRANINLPADIQLGLESGVPLQFIVSLTVKSPKPLWRDDVLLQAEYRFRLVYYELTRHYRIQSVETNRSTNKRSLLSALDELGTVNLMDVTPWVSDAVGLANAKQSRVATVSIALDQRALPLPLQPLFSSDWRLASEEFVWPLS